MKLDASFAGVAEAVQGCRIQGSVTRELGGSNPIPRTYYFCSVESLFFDFAAFF